MRIFRLSDKFFNSIFEVCEYLSETLPKEQEYKFYQEGIGKVSEDSIQTGDTILFSYKHDIVGIGILESGRLLSDDLDCKYMFKFKPNSIKIFPRCLDINDLHEYLKSHGVKVGKPFIPRCDWPLIDNKYTALVIGWIKIKIFNYYDNL